MDNVVRGRKLEDYLQRATAFATELAADAKLRIKRKFVRAPHEDDFLLVETLHPKEVVCLTICIGGRRSSWVEYDAEQLDALIDVLCRHRDTLERV